MRATCIGEGGVELTLLSDTLRMILRVEERIEGKLDRVMSTMLSSETILSFHSADAQAIGAMEAETEHCREGSQGAESDDLSDNQLHNQNRERRCSSKIKCGVTRGDALWDRKSTPNMNASISQRTVQMRSAFQILIDARDVEVENGDQLMLAISSSCTGPPLQESKLNMSLCIPINPNSPFPICWAFFTIVVLAAQLTYVPFELAWNVQHPEVSLCFATFWSLDICMNFLNGTYNKDGETNPMRVSAKEYAKNSFSLDIVLVVIDWISIFDWDGINFVKLLRTSKIARMVRICAFLRMSKTTWILDRMVDRAPLATWSRMILRVAYLCVSILWFLHITACSWFLIGNIGLTDTGERWLDLPTLMADGTPLDLRNKELSIQYIVSLHWSVATFTLGNMEVGNANIFERVFGLVVNIVSFFFGSVVISLLSTTFVEHQASHAEEHEKLRTVDRFLWENRVRRMSCLRVQKVCIERLKMAKKLTFREATALEELPSSLYKELRYEIIGRFLAKHDLFNCWSTLNKRTAEEYSVDGVDMIFCEPGDDLFEANRDSEQAYFLSSGALKYAKTDRGRHSYVTLLPLGTWLSEAALWSHWRHVGTCEAQSRCQIAVASYKGLAHHVRRYPLILSVTLSYCQLFCRGIALAAPPISEFPDDICVPFTKFAEMLMHFPNELRVLISKRALDVSKLGKTCAEKLQEEVNEGKCALYVNIDGELERTVAVTVLVLNNDEGNVLYQVGKSVPTSMSDNGEEGPFWEFVPEFRLLGLIQDQREDFEETIKRLVDTKLPILNEKFEHIRTQFDEETSASREFGLETRYFRTKMICSMRDAFPAKLVTSGNVTCARRQPTNCASPRSQTRGRRPSSSKQRSAALVSYMQSLSLSPIPLYVVFEGTRPCIYAWLSQDTTDMLNETSQHHRDDVLTEILSNIDHGIIEQRSQEESNQLYFDRFPM